MQDFNGGLEDTSLPLLMEENFAWHVFALIRPNFFMLAPNSPI